MSDDRVFAKCAWRLIPFMVLLYVVNYLDRTNIGFAALTMNKDLGFSPSVFGFGAGIFFVSYALFQLPSNIMLDRLGARRWIFCILAAWGAISAANALIRDSASFYGLRFLLGVAEAGFHPGMLLYLTYWFPKAYLCRFTALFMTAPLLSLVIGGPLASMILGMDGIAGLHGWQWLFLLEGGPTLLLALTVLKFLPDGPLQASWLTSRERETIAARLGAESVDKDSALLQGLRNPRVIAVGLSYAGVLFAAYALNFWLPQIVQAMGFSNGATGWVVGLVYLAGIPAMILWGRSSDRRGERIWHAALPALLAAGALILASIFQDCALLVLLALSVGVIGYASGWAPLYSLPSSFLRGKAAAAGIALFNTIGTLLGGFFGPFLLGVVRELTGGYAAAMAMIAAVLILSAAIVLALGRAMARRPAAMQPAAGAAE